MAWFSTTSPSCPTLSTEPETAEEWSGKEEPDESEGVVRRPTRACDTCRHSKKRCDGLFPCSRCTVTARACTYSAPKRRKPRATGNHPSRSSAPSSHEPGTAPSQPGPQHFQVKLDPSNTLLSQQVTAQSFLNVFFERIYVINKMMDLDIRQFERPSSKPVLLQFYAAVATSSRALSPHGSEYRMFESQARQLAGELFDDLHEETAVGFHLLAFFAHGEDFARGSHYREMSKSMCQRLLERRDLSEESRMRLVRLEIMNASLRGIQDVATARDYDQVSHQASMLPPMAGGDCLPLEELLAMFSFRTRFASLFNVEEAPFESLAIRPLLLEEIREFSRMIDHHVQWFVQDKLVAPNQVDLAYATFCIFKTVILYAGHRAQDALVLLKQAIYC